MPNKKKVIKNVCKNTIKLYTTMQRQEISLVKNYLTNEGDNRMKFMYVTMIGTYLLELRNELSWNQIDKIEGFELASIRKLQSYVSVYQLIIQFNTIPRSRTGHRWHALHKEGRRARH